MFDNSIDPSTSYPKLIIQTTTQMTQTLQLDLSRSQKHTPSSVIKTKDIDMTEM